MNKDNYLAIDIGGSKILCAVTDGNGTILERIKCPVLRDSSFPDIWTIIEQSCNELMANNAYNCKAIGATIPGLVDKSIGEWVYAPFSGIKHVKIVNIFEDAFSIPAFIENDVNACALSEKYFGKCQSTDNYIWITVSTGIGSGICINGELYYGEYGFSGELGHICVEYDARKALLCGCGCYGCAEAMAAGPGIIKRYLALNPGADPRITAKDIADLAKIGDALAISVYAKTGEYLGRAIASAINLLNPEKVILGGGIALDYDLFAAPLNEAVFNNIMRRGNKDLTITTTALGYDAALYGAIATVLSQYKA